VRGLNLGLGKLVFKFAPTLARGCKLLHLALQPERLRTYLFFLRSGPLWRDFAASATGHIRRGALHRIEKWGNGWPRRPFKIVALETFWKNWS